MSQKGWDPSVGGQGRSVTLLGPRSSADLLGSFSIGIIHVPLQSSPRVWDSPLRLAPREAARLGSCPPTSPWWSLESIFGHMCLQELGPGYSGGHSSANHRALAAL